MRFLLLCLVAVVSVWGQSPDVPRILLADVRSYLALTDAQAQKISEQNSEFARWSAMRSQRMYEVQFEISVETAREPLDPAGLGVRYAEVEAIRREIAERNTKLIAANVAVLTPAQVVKLKALEEALKLVSTGNDAQALKLLPDSCSNPSGIATGVVQPGIVIRDPFPGALIYGLGPYCAPRYSFFPGGVFLP